ncbi:MAG: tetratricopeptide repeat protein [Treponema sp.]|nr:tetratricopeptide repeat protein [Treponema sp.]
MEYLKMVINIRKFVFIFYFLTLVIYSCGSSPEVPHDNDEPVVRQFQGGIAEEIRTLTETGILSSMLDALELIRNRDISATEFGRMMTGINVLLIRLVYPDSVATLPMIDLPLASNYSHIIREAQRGNYISPASASVDFFEHILPFLAINEQTGSNVLSNALRDLNKAVSLQPSSVLPLYFTGLILEREGRYNEAEVAYRRAYNISNRCYPAQIGIGRIKRFTGNANEAIDVFSDLAIHFPDSNLIRRELAISYFVNRDWSRALSSVDEILRMEPRDGDFLLLRASILIEQGLFSQANISLDSYASINPNNRTYLFLRARVQAEGNRNRDSALNYLRSILRSSPNDVEAMTYASTLLMESSRPADQAEGRELLERLRLTSGSSIDVLSLSLRDAIQRESWQEAMGFLNRIFTVRRTDQDLIDGYYIEHNLRNNTRAFNYARELYERDNSNNEYTIIYISALIDNGRRDEASRLVESRLASVSGGQVMSRYYFLRSRLQTNQDSALNDLRSSLFEDPRNLDAIISMFEIYHVRREERRAVHYLRQALAISPDHPRLRPYMREYAPLLERN